MNNQAAPRLNKVPFLVGDVLLLAAAFAVEFMSPTPPTIWNHLLCVFAVGLGAILLVIPFLREHESQIELLNSGELTSSLAQIQKLEDVGRQVAASTTHWQAIQDQANKTFQQVTDASGKITTEARQIAEFVQKANETEKNHLRLEVEKLRRAEADWVQVVVRLLDHTFALHQAAERSGQASVIEQVGQFQFACRDAARRIGLNTVTAAPGDFYETARHQIYEAPEPPPGSRIASMLATGISFQGHLVRKILVTVQDNKALPETEPLAPASDLSDSTSTPEQAGEALEGAVSDSGPVPSPGAGQTDSLEAESKIDAEVPLAQTDHENSDEPKTEPQTVKESEPPANEPAEGETPRKKQKSDTEWSNQRLLF